MSPALTRRQLHTVSQEQYAAREGTTVAQQRRAAHDQQEVARFLREQPPTPIPRRTWQAPIPGLIALSVLGGRVIRRLD